jgi:hypothetical protein
MKIKNITEKVLGCLILITGLLYTQTSSIIYFEMNMFRVSVILLFLASLFDYKKRDFTGNSNVLILSVLCVLNVILHDFNGYVIDCTINVFLSIIGYKVIYEYITDISAFYKIFLYVGLCNVVIYILQILGLDFVTRNWDKGVFNGGFCSNLPRLTTLVAIIFPLCYSVNKYLSLLLLPALLIFPQMWAFTCVFIFLLTRLKDNKKYFIYISIIIFELFIIFQFIQYYKQFDYINQLYNLYGDFRYKILNRLNMIFIALQFIFEHGIKGTGLGIFPEIMQKDFKLFDPTINSSLFQFIMQIGLLGVIYIYDSVLKLKNNFNRHSVLCMSVFSIMFMSVLEYPFEINRMRLIIITIVALWSIEVNKIYYCKKELINE